MFKGSIVREKRDEKRVLLYAKPACFNREFQSGLAAWYLIELYCWVFVIILTYFYGYG